MRRTPWFVIVLSALAVTLAACGGSSRSPATEHASGSGGSDESTGSQRTVAGEQINFHGTKDVSNATSVDIEADNFYFKPSVLTGKPGEQLTVHIENEGSTEHNFTIASQKVDKDLETGDKATLHVTIPRSGVIAFFCEYHRNMGMAGGLAVNGASLGGASTTGSTTGSSSGSGSNGYGSTGYGGGYGTG